MARPKIKISKDKLKDLYLNKKLSLDLITKEFCCNERTIFARLYEYKIPIRYDKKRNDITEEKLKDLYLDKKMSIGKIAGMFKCSKGTIWSKFCQYNIEARTKSEANRGKYRVEISGAVLRDLYINKKFDTSQIARKFNCSTKTIVERLHRYGIPIRKIRINIPRETLEDLYVNKEKTIYQIAKKFKCDPVTILDRLNQYNIPIKKKGKVRESDQEIIIPKDKLKDLYLDKGLTVSEIVKIFGGSHGTIYKRLRRYDLVRKKGEALKGKPSTFKGKHHTLETRKKLSEATTKQLASGKMRRENTSIESEMERELQRNNIYYQKQVPLCNITVVDFYLPEYKIAIYADGAYWHNLSIVKERDEKQSKILEENGYKVFRFREHEIKKSVKRCVNEIRRYVQIRDGPVSSGSKILLGKNKIYV